MTPVCIVFSAAGALLVVGALVLACGGWRGLRVRFEDEMSVPATITGIEVTGHGGGVEVTDRGGGVEPAGRGGGVEAATAAGTQIRLHLTVRYLRLLGRRPDVTPRIDGTVMVLPTSPRWYCAVDYLVCAPEGTSVRARLTSGDVRLTGSSNVDVKTTSGAIELTRVGGDVTVRSTSGEIRGDALRPTTVTANATSGDVTLHLAAPADVRARTTSGDLTLVVPDGGYRIDARTSSGAKRIRAADDPSGRHRLDLRTSSGDLTVTHP